MKLEFQEYKPRKIVNVHKHVDGLVLGQILGPPLRGCRSGCEFCYARGGYYLGKRDPATFDTLIQVKSTPLSYCAKNWPRLPPT